MSGKPRIGVMVIGLLATNVLAAPGDDIYLVEKEDPALVFGKLLSMSTRGFFPVAVGAAPRRRMARRIIYDPYGRVGVDFRFPEPEVKEPLLLVGPGRSRDFLVALQAGNPQKIISAPRQNMFLNVANVWGVLKGGHRNNEEICTILTMGTCNGNPMESVAFPESSQALHTASNSRDYWNLGASSLLRFRLVKKGSAVQIERIDTLGSSVRAPVAWQSFPIGPRPAGAPLARTAGVLASVGMTEGRVEVFNLGHAAALYLRWKRMP